MRSVDFRYRILRNDAFLGYLSAPMSTAPRLFMDSDSEIKGSFAGTFAPVATDAGGEPIAVNWLADEIQPVLIVDGVEHPLGVFAAASVTPVEKENVETLEIEAYDRCWRVRDTNATAPVFFAAGTNYVSAIETLLVASGISIILATPTTETLAEARADWDVGESYLTIVNTLLSEINYNPLFFTPEGYAVLEPASVPSAENIDHRLSDDPQEIANGAGAVSGIFPQISRETDIYRAPNVFVVVCANPDKSGNMIATAENNNPQSPLSVARRGRRIVSVTRVDNIASQRELERYAARLCNESLIGGESIEVSTELLPGYLVADVVGLRYKDLAALCILKSYSMELRVGGTMTMTLERVIYNFDD